jgi:Protein of unknown function (DUF3575)
MKKTLIILLAVIFSFPAFSQEKTTSVATEKNVLKINTLSLFVLTPSIFYERKISDMTSAQFGVGYMGYKVSDVKFTGLFLTPEFRIYPKKNAIDGFYIAPYLRYMNLSVKSTTDDAKASLTVIGGGLLFGRQWITKSGFNMDLFFGGHYGSGSAKANSGTTSWFDSNLFSGFRTRVGFAIGFAF